MVYKPYLINNNATAFWRDGTNCPVLNENHTILFGWNSGNTPTLNNDFYLSTNKGATFTLQATPPVGIRHTGGAVVCLQKIWVWGGNDVMDVWNWTPAAGWVEFAPHWSVGASWEHFSRCLHWVNGIPFLYVMGGHEYNTPANETNKIYRIALTGGAAGVWELVLDYAGEAFQNINSGCLLSTSTQTKNGKLILAGGGRVISDGNNQISQKVWENTTDGFEVWTEIADTPLLNSFLWGDMAINAQGHIFGISGSDAVNDMTGPNNRLVLSLDEGYTWQLMGWTLPGRHATGVTAHGNDFYLSCGFNRNDYYRIKMVASAYRCYAEIYND